MATDSSMKRVGIVTILGGDNYGNKLQHYAIRQVLHRLGYECDAVLDTTVRGFATSAYPHTTADKLRPSYIGEAIRSRLQYKYYRKDSDESIIHNIRRARINGAHYGELKRQRKAVFDAFTERYLPFGELSVSATVRPDEQKLSEYSAFVCGSDQVWNPVYPNTSPIRFLQFAPEHKRIALSPSFGVASIPEPRKQAYAAFLRSIPHLSVREQQGAEIIKDLTGRSVPVLVDPTLMLTASDWMELEKKPVGFADEPFLLTYFLGGKDRTYKRQIASIAASRGLRIINLLDITEDESFLFGPQEFIYLMHHADFVCTDSFHGTVFSILFERDFWVFSRAESGFNKDNRTVTLLNKLDLCDHLFCEGKELKKADYSHTSDLLEKERRAFNNYLSEALITALKPVKQRVYLNVAEWNEAHKTHCTGCSACQAACPKGCISMKTDAEGFLYPSIEESSCIHCRVCLNTCLAAEKLSGSCPPKGFAVQNKDESIRLASSSGGVFYSIARTVIENGGTVFGARLDNNHKPIHTTATTMEELHPLLGSKYVQSEVGNNFVKAKSLLDKGETVLFSGTPCQTAGLRAFLRKDYENLILIDIICHGTPSNKAWQAYLKGHKPIKNASFRNKDKGWATFSMRLDRKKGFYRKDLETDPYLYAFLHNLDLRESCYDCRFKTVKRCSDLTLADFWGVNRVTEGFNDDKGTSLVLVHSQKGEELLDGLNDELRTREVLLEQALKFNSAAEHSVLRPNARETFYTRLNNEPFKKVCPKINKSVLTKVKERLYKLKNRRKA